MSYNLFILNFDFYDVINPVRDTTTKLPME